MLPKVSKNDAKFEQTTIEPIRKQYRLINTTTILPKHYILAPAFFLIFLLTWKFYQSIYEFFYIINLCFLAWNVINF